MTHVIDINANADGTEIVDHLLFCSEACQDVALRIFRIDAEVIENSAPAGLLQLPDGGSASYGLLPGGCETDYDVWCAACGDFLWHGLECECQDKDVDRDPVPVREGELLR